MFSSQKYFSSVFHENTEPRAYTYIFEIHMQLESNENNIKFRLRIEKFNRLTNKTRYVHYAYSEDAFTILHYFKQQANQYLNEKLFSYNLKLPAALSGSKQLQSIAIHEKLGSTEESFVNYIWNESIGNLISLFDIKDTRDLRNFNIEQVYNISVFF